MFVCFGNASGPIEPFASAILATKGPLYFTRAALKNSVVNTKAYIGMAADLFGLIEAGIIKIRIHHVYPLSEVPQAIEI